VQVIRALIVAVALGACLHPAEVACDDGRVCPFGTQCDDRHRRCITQDELDACGDRGDGAQCSVAGRNGVCEGGVCVLAVCGDGVRDAPEDCDGADLGGADCTTLGFYDAAGLACTAYCTFDVNACTGSCGDGVVDGPEICDGAPPPGKSCADFGFDVGALGCLPHFCTPDFSGCGFIGWTPTFTPSAADLTAVWVASARVAYAVAAVDNTGLVLRYDGARWAQVASFPGISLVSVSGSADDDIYAVGIDVTTLDGFVEHWDGLAWTPVVTTTGVPLHSVFAISASDVYAVGNAGTMYHFDGATWTSTTVGTADLFSLWARSASDVWALARGTLSIHYDGTRWRGVVTPAPQTQTAVTGVGAGAVYMTTTDALGVDRVLHCPGSCEQGLWGSTIVTFLGRGLWGTDSSVFITRTNPIQILHDSPNGEFLFSDLAIAGALEAIGGDSAGHLMAVGQNGVALRYRGSMWDRGGPVVDFLWSADGVRLYGVTRAGTCVVDHGTIATTACSANPLNAISGASATNVIGVGDLGTVVRFTTAWSAMQIGPENLYGVSAGVTTSYAVGAAGAVYVSTNGTTWTKVATPPVTESLRAVWATSDASTVFAVGDAGRVVQAGPAGWTTYTLADAAHVAQDLKAVWGTSADDVWAAGANGTAFHFDGVAWRPVDTAGTFVTLRAIWGSAANDVFIAGDLGTVVALRRTRLGAGKRPAQAQRDVDLGRRSADVLRRRYRRGRGHPRSHVVARELCGDRDVVQRRHRRRLRLPRRL
jgi:hypothetical protein